MYICIYIYIERERGERERERERVPINSMFRGRYCTGNDLGTLQTAGPITHMSREGFQGLPVTPIAYSFTGYGLTLGGPATQY